LPIRTLASVADRIRSALASADIAARLGGDKFDIVQVDQPQPQWAAALASRLVDLIGRSYLVEGHLIDVAASVGIVLLPTEATGCDQLLKNTDLALHRAKSDGHGAYRFFERAMDEKMQYRRNLEIDLRCALAHGEFSLVYQPQLNLRLEKVTGFEALLRWQVRSGVPCPRSNSSRSRKIPASLPRSENGCFAPPAWRRQPGPASRKFPSMFRRSSS
jgi:predicted signal transduction protein with EAL and GGDEF domain